MPFVVKLTHILFFSELNQLSTLLKPIFISDFIQ